MEQDELKKLIEKELGMEEFPEELQDEMIGKIGEQVMLRITLEILKRLTPEEQEEFEKIVSEGDYQAGYEFASSKISGFQEFVKGEALKELVELKK